MVKTGAKPRDAPERKPLPAPAPAAAATAAAAGKKKKRRPLPQNQIGSPQPWAYILIPRRRKRMLKQLFGISGGMRTRSNGRASLSGKRQHST